MSPITLLPRGPTLGTMPAAVGMALMTTEIRLAAALSRTLPAILPAVMHRNATLLLDVILILELTVLVLRLTMLVLEFLLIETMREATAPAGALLLGATFLAGVGVGLGPVASGLAALASVAVKVAVTAAIARFAQNMRSRPQAVPEYGPCHSKN